MNLKGLLGLLSLCLIFLFTSCTKINEATELGDDLIPAVDNVNTFDTTLTIQAAYLPFNDTTRAGFTDNLAVGRLNDPEFGTTNADLYFDLSAPTYGSYPFGGNKDSIQGIDSVVLSLSYQGGYGDTTNSQISVQVSEIATSSLFSHDSAYFFNHPGFSTNPAVLGSRTFIPKNLRDSVAVIRKGDTSKTANVLRIPLNNSIASKLTSFDTSNGFKNDSAFHSLFRGLAVKTSSVSGQGALAYFGLYDAKTQLTVYYRKKNGTVDSAASVSFIHTTSSSIKPGQANSIVRSPAGSYVAGLNNSTVSQFYVQTSPSGSYIGMKVPDLSTFPNKVIHRAELIAYKVPSAMDNIFTPPARLILDRANGTAATDTAFTFENDIQIGFDGSLSLGAFGGNLRSDDSYRFNITRYVQAIVTRKERNDSLRIYAPLRTNLFAKNLGLKISIPNLVNIASGRVVVASPNYPNPAMRLRLRVIYSNL
ncbi:MAG: DUF4270 family protein [Chitinophagaceae bacterium]|nr:MAG: DUF4270 family protein [Chitinophagaceae bacterium]